MDGMEQALKRHAFSIRSHYQNPTVPDTHFSGVDLYEFVLVQVLESARDVSALPETPSAFDALNDLLLRVRGV
jgi:hypothetical protein